MNQTAVSVPQASENAQRIDFAFFSVLGISTAIFLLLCALLAIFVIRYRRGSPAKRGPLPELLRKEIEIGWTAATAFLAIFIFWWFVAGYDLPPRAGPGQIEIHVVAKQWMWKVEHPDGAREINALHVPIDHPVRLVMTSQDVIHSFFVPAFRLKQDVLPGRATQLFFTPTKMGQYHLFCAEFCGTQHSHMTGIVTVMDAQSYEAWAAKQPKGKTAADRGGVLFTGLGCGGCHNSGAATAPALAGIFGGLATLSDGRQVRVDEAYLRTAILLPRDQEVAGYKPTMPSYGAIASTEEIEDLVAYIKSLPAKETRHD